MQVLRDLYTRENMPHKLGAPETNFLYRKHHNKDVIKIMNMWWNMIEKYSNRDQASFMYVIWKKHIDADSIFIPNLRMDAKDFAFSDHKEYTNAYSLLNIEKYKRAIDGHKVILFDISDTLLVRPYLRHSDFFRHLEVKECRPGFATARIEAEKTARGAENHDGVTLDLIYSNIADEYKPMEKSEKAFELQVSLAHPVLKRLYEYALKQEKRVIAVSDSYYPEEFIIKLLNKNGYRMFDDIIDSERKHESAEGSEPYYPAALNKAECIPADILHIGCNLSASEKESSGIDNLAIENISDHLFEINQRAKAFSAECMDRLECSIYLGILAIHSACTQEYLSRKEYFENLGYEYGGVAAYQFLRFVYESCLKDDIKDVIMSSKDGYTLQRVFDLFNRENLNSHFVFVPERESQAINSQRGTALDEIPSESDRISLKNFKADDSEFTPESKLDITGGKNIYVSSELKKSEYVDYLAQFSYDSPRLAFVSLSDLRTQNVLEKMWPKKQITGFYWRNSKGKKPREKVFDSKGESKGILEPWDFIEVLFRSTDFNLEDIFSGKPVHKTASSDSEQFLTDNYLAISDGIVRFTEDVQRIFGEKKIDFSPLLTAHLLKSLRHNLSVYDRKYLKELGLITFTEG